jgi:chitin synthase
MQGKDYDARSRFTSRLGQDETNSRFGSESYALSRNMSQNTDKRGLMEKETLAGEIQDGETTKASILLKESSARRRWVALCWLLAWWIPPPCLTHVGRLKRMDIRQAWREKLALNLLI